MISQEQRDRAEENIETEHLDELAEDILKEKSRYGEYEGFYDDTPEPGQDGLYGLALNEGLTDAEMEFASRLALLSMGVMLVHGAAGSGKGTFGTYTGWKVRRIFKNKKVLLDFQPKPVFDYGFENNRYKFFDCEMMMTQVDRMADWAEKGLRRDAVTELKGDEKELARVMADKWAHSKEAQVLMKDAVWELDELKRYLHNRHPNNRVGIQISNILTQWRHLRMLCIGMCINAEEIDFNGFLQYLTYEVRPESCTRWKPHTMKCIIRRKTHVSSTSVVKFASKPYPLFVNGGRPRPEIGVQLLHPELPMGVPEKRIVDFLLTKQADGYMPAYFSNLNEISEATGEEINICNQRLKKMHGEYPSPGKLLYNPDAILKCMCFFQLFNSLDYKNLNPRIRQEE